MISIATYLLWYFYLEPKLRERHEENTWQYILITAAYTVGCSLLFYYIILPILRAFFGVTASGKVDQSPVVIGTAVYFLIAYQVWRLTIHQKFN